MVEPVGNAPTRIVRLKAGCPSIVALTPLKLVLCSPRRLCVLPNVPVGSHLWGQLPIISVLVNSDVFCCSFSMFFKLLRLPLILSPDCSIWCITNKNGGCGGIWTHNLSGKSRILWSSWVTHPLKLVQVVGTAPTRIFWLRVRCPSIVASLALKNCI